VIVAGIGAGSGVQKVQVDDRMTMGKFNRSRCTKRTQHAFRMYAGRTRHCGCGLVKALLSCMLVF
jgi:hypothetical protein